MSTTSERIDTKEEGISEETSSSRGGSLTGTYRRNGKTEQRSSGRGGKQGKTSAVTEDQHGITPRTPDTQTREVSQPSRTPGKNSVLSASGTVKGEQLGASLRVLNVNRTN